MPTSSIKVGSPTEHKKHRPTTRPIRSRLARLFVVGAAAALAAGCTTLPPGNPSARRVSAALDPTTDTPLKRAFTPLIAGHPGDSGYRILSAGVAGLTARVEIIDSATRALDLQYYIFRADVSGRLIADALLRAADRGVRIRILLDDGDTVRGDEKILSLTAKPGIEVRIFNPMRYRGHIKALRGLEFFVEKGRLDYRMHNKLLVADNAVALVGGRNIGDQYFQIDPESQFGDDDVVVAGPMVQRLSGVFDEFWNSDLVATAASVDRRDTSQHVLSAFAANLPSRQQSLGVVARQSPTSAALRPFVDVLEGRTPLQWCQATLAYDSPDKKDIDRGNAAGRLIYRTVAAEATAVHDELLMVTPYFIPSPDELALLKVERARAVTVRVLTNSLDAAPSLPAHSGYMKFRPELLRAGVQLYEVRALLGGGRGSGQTQSISRYGKYGLHAKLYVFDRRSVFIGSMNYDHRSNHLNTEIGLLIRSPDLAEEIARRFGALTQLDNSYAVSLAEPRAGLATGLKWTTQENGRLVEYRDDPTASTWRRVKVKMLSHLPLDKEL